MCELCSTGKEKDDAVQRHLDIANRLINLGQMYKALARGLIKPHEKECNNVEMSARRLIKILVDDWM